MKTYFVLIGKLILCTCIIPASSLNAQIRDSLQHGKIIIKAGPQYKKGFLHQFLWGKHYRPEWLTPVEFHSFSLDSAGLTPYQAGGGRQSKTLRLHDSAKKEYVLRSIDKTFGRALPEIFQGSFVETIINDQVSIAHPYAALTIPDLAEAAKVYHTWPRIVFVPRQKALDTFNTRFGNDLYLFEQRPDENWEEAKNFASSKKIISSENLLEKIHEKSSHRVDQLQYVRSRLFDMFIGDWGRHEDQWRWASLDSGNNTIYKAIPRDRDQVYTKFDGVLLNIIKSSAGIGHLQSFDDRIHNVRTYNYPARNLDRHLANETTLDQWIAIAREIQQLVSDSLIETSVKKLPREVFPLSGNEIITKLKSRRQQLPEFAREYYKFLALEVGITGTTNAEHFVISQSDQLVKLEIFDLNAERQPKKEPYYSRTFSPEETNELRVFGLDGRDSYDIQSLNTPIKIRIIGGPGQDEYRIQGKPWVHIYDSEDQQFPEKKGVYFHLSEDTAIHQFEYDEFRYSKTGFGPSFFYSRDDRIYVGLKYTVLQHKWRREPFANNHVFYGRYSIQQTSFHLGYKGLVNQFLGKWNLLVNAEYDWIRWTNFFGLGNESVMKSDDRDFHRIRSRQGNLNIGFNHAVGRKGSITVSPFYQTIKLVNDTERFLTKDFMEDNPGTEFIRKHFAGTSLSYSYTSLDNKLLPTRGIHLEAATGYTRNLNESKSFTTLSGNVQLYFPISDHLVLSVNNGAATMNGKPEFYQLNNIGGRLLRGYRRERFWGETIYHNNNELQYLFNVKSWVYNGKMGVFGFADQGRVWLKGEDSRRWHVGYGGGIILSPFNKVYISVMYGISKETGLIHLDFRGSL